MLVKGNLKWFSQQGEGSQKAHQGNAMSQRGKKKHS